MATKFSEQQQAVIENRGGNLLVSAAAGSGKTTVLVERIMQYLLDPSSPANLDDFLIITYTKAAASELRTKISKRLSELIAENPGNVHLKRQVQRLYLAGISTVHAFCSDLLRQYAYQSDIPMDFRVAEETECQQIKEDVAAKLLEQAYENAELDPDFCAFADTQGIGRNDKDIPKIIYKIFDASRCHTDPDAWLERCLQNCCPDSSIDLTETPWGTYLVRSLRSFLALQLEAYEAAIKKAEKYSELAKVTAILSGELQQMKQLRDSINWDAFVTNKNIHFDTLRFPQKNPDPDLAEQIKSMRNACKENLKHYTVFFTESSEQIYSDSEKLSAGARGLVSLVRAFSKEYARVKNAKRILDFSDLEQKTLDLLLGKKRTGETSIAKEVSKRYREIMVDEYQDSNQVQDAIFGALTREKRNCFMVGDVKQSIYRFRLADPGIFLSKYQSFVPAELANFGEDRKILLSSNYRSGIGVLNSVNDVFTRCMSPAVGGLEYGPDESLREGIPHITLPEPEIELYAVNADSESYATEARFVANRIKELLDGTHYIRDKEALKPIGTGDIAILLRSPGTNGVHFQRALETAGIPYRSENGENLLVTEEIETLRSLLCCISNPRQDIPLLSVLCSPFFGFTADDLAEVRKADLQGTFYEAMLACPLEKAKVFCDLLTAFREKSQTERLSGLLTFIYSSLELESIYGIRPDGIQKQKNLRQFYQFAVDYENSGRRDLDMFLHHLDSLEEKGIAIGADASSNDCITIQSIHKSKGLEYPVVFLCGLAKAFNKQSARGRVLCDKELGIGLSIVDTNGKYFYPSTAKEAISEKEEQESLSEEMRVLYVAMTRARDRLIMTFTKNNLPAYFTEVGNRIALENPALMASRVKNMGEWVIQSAMQRTEAGAFFAIGAKHHETKMGDPRWHIEVVDAADPLEAEKSESVVKEALTEELSEHMKQGLSFEYPYEAAVMEPSKQTATQQKGRHKDEEAAQNAEESSKENFSWRKHEKAAFYGKEHGIAVHRAMQYLDFRSITDLTSLQNGLRELVNKEILSDEELSSISSEQLFSFFQSRIGERLKQANEVLREFKFTILEPGEKYNDALKGEEILMQGVIDLAFVEPDGIVIIDFKTDFVKDLSEKVQHYSGQVNTYAAALERIYEMPVKEKYLFFFRTGDLASV